MILHSKPSKQFMETPYIYGVFCLYTIVNIYTETSNKEHLIRNRAMVEKAISMHTPCDSQGLPTNAYR